jgi:signal transduction histidine kinase
MNCDWCLWDVCRMQTPPQTSAYEHRIFLLQKNWKPARQPETGEEHAIEVGRLQNYIEGLCASSINCLPEIEFAAFYLSGFKARTLSPLALWPSCSPHKVFDAPKRLFPLRKRNRLPYRPTADQQLAIFGNVQLNGEVWIADLHSREEHIGFVVLVTYNEASLSPLPIEETEAVLALLNRLVGDAVFAYRMEVLAAPIRTKASQPSQSEYCSAAASTLVKGIGVDGVIIRLLRKDHNTLEEMAREGHLLESADSELLQSNRERICRKVFESSSGFAVLSTHADGSKIAESPPESIEMGESEIRLLNEIGIKSLVLIRLESNRRQTGLPERLGTIAAYASDPRKFSSRDLQLLHTFSQRTSDDISLFQAKEELDTYRLKLETSMDACTRAELVALLAHDLYKRIENVGESVEELIAATTKALREKRGIDFISSFTEKATKQTEELANRIHQIKRSHRRLDEKPDKFNVADIAEDVRDTVEPSVRAIKMTCEVLRQPGNLNLVGVASVWRMVLLNLVMNSIDAQKNLRKQKLNHVLIKCREESVGGKRSVVVIVSDDGPGINRGIFQNPQAIFDMGVTSKSTGTGLGLPVSRSLIQTYFDGSLLLLADKPTVFEVVLYDQAESYRK